MQTQIKTRQKQIIWSKLCQCLGLLLFSFILTACGQSANPQQGVISDDKLSAPLPKAITALLVDDTSLIVDVVVNGDTDNPLRVKNLAVDTVDTTAGTFSGDVSGVPTGTSTLSLVYSIIDPTFGTIEVIRTADITVNVIANEDTPADFSSAEITYTDTDGDGISNLGELDAGTDPRTPNYTVGGQVEGLTGSGLVLQNNGSDNLTISANGVFSFSPTAIDGDEYTVSVLTQPGNPNQICIVNNDNGTIRDAAVSNVTVICSTISYTVGGTVSGYTGGGLVLQNNGSDDLTISKNGTFTFSSAIIDGSEYAVSVQTLPNSPNQICSVSNGSGTLGGAAISNVAITCSTNAYTVSGTVSGYAGSGLVLQNNDSDNLTINTEGNFIFGSAVADGSEYTVTVLAQPNSPNQVCTVNNGSGSISGAAVSDVAVTCLTTSYTIGGTVSGYTGSGLVLQNNDGDDLPVSADGTFSFSNALVDGSEYAVSVQTQPSSPNQTCTVSNDSGSISGAPVSDVAVTCLTTSYTVGGTISGYTGSGLVLQNNDGDDLPMSADGTFSFSNALVDGSGYSVSVQTQPSSPNQICTVSNGSGTISGAPVSNVAVACLTTSYLIGGTVSGYTGSGLVLQINDSDELAINAEENFTFGSAVADGGEYTVTVLTQPNSPNQACTVSNDNGTIRGAPVSDVAVTCLTTSYSVGGTVSGYTGSGLVLQNNDGDDLLVSTDGAFSFSNALPDGSEYVVSIQTQPGSPNQICTVSNGSGTLNGAAVSDVAIICSADAYTIGGTVSGYDSSGLVLQNNGRNDLAITAEGSFTFSSAVANGSNYTVTVLTQPDNLNQICTVSDVSGIVSDAAVSSVSVICNTNAAPTSTSVNIDDVNGGNTAVGKLLQGSYVYSDAESDPEGESTFRWLADDVAIANATTTSYTPVTIDIGKTITFEVTPVASSGVLTGAPVRSNGLKVVTNNPPFFTSGSAIGVAEDIILTGYTATAKDADGDTITFSLSGGTDQAVLSIDSDSGVLSFNIPTRFKAPADSDGNNTYVVEITATDGIHSISRSVIVTVRMAILEVSVSTANIKTVRFEWPAYVDATHYKLFVNPDVVSGFSPVQDSFSETSITITLPVHLTDWINARYILEAYDASDNKLTESASVSIEPVMLSSIGYFKASNTGEGDGFGGAISLSADGNTLAVGAIKEDSIASGVCPGSSCSGGADNTASDPGAVYVFSRNNGVWEQQAYVKASNTEGGDGFGHAVSLSRDGNTLAVGAHGEDSTATGVSTDGSGEDDNTAINSGAVYVFSRSDGVWSQQAYVKASNTGASDSFGEVVSLSTDGNTLAVGVRLEDSAATGVSNDGSGEDDNTASGSGAVYVFSRSGSAWSQQAYVKASNTEGGDLFGFAVSLSSDANTLAVGADGEDSAATGASTDGSGENDNTAINSGAVYVFSRNGGVWEQQAYVKASNSEKFDGFGHAVSLSSDGNTLAVGAFVEDSAATGVSSDGSGENDNTARGSGAAYVFSRSDGFWSQQAYVKASNTGASDQFGDVVSLSGNGNILAVGTNWEDSAATGTRTDGSGEADNAAFNAGAVYVFSRNGNTWSQQAYIKASNTEEDDGFGFAVSLSGDGNMLAVGAIKEDSSTTGISTGGSTNNSANDAGAVYLY
ncbi:MAG: hypothetical protein L3J98_12085 [Gammaproteobacteria bacterium]|nr:hypothetical protein [Gammaproteobacteria bacterium]MCF6260878.1 hypothetical protein [Gammaproteobacteria bacterium]